MAWRQDVGHSLRALRKRPGFVLTALLAVILGISATTTVFSLINAVLIRSLPYKDAEKLLYLWTPLRNVGGIKKEISPLYEDMMAWRRASRSFEDITAVQRYSAFLNSGNAERVGAARVLGNFFQTFGALPETGRGIDAKDDRVEAPLVVVISDRFWRSRLGSDADVLRKTIYLDRHAYRVIGVMPKEFSFPSASDFPGQYQFASVPRTDIWVPAAVSMKECATPDFGFDAVIGRLRTGVGLSRATAELSAMENRLASRHPAGTPEVGVLLVPLIQSLLRPVRPLLHLLMGAVCLVLCMAAGNLASLLMARGAERVHEMGVRTALGARRSHLIRLLLTESLMLSLAGALLAVPVCYAALKALVRLNPGDIPRFEEVTLDWHVLLFGLFVAFGTGLAAGLLPALSASMAGANTLLRQGGRGIIGNSLGTRNALIIAEIALSVVLLAGAGTLIRSYLFVQGEDKGFAPSTLTMSVQLDPQSKPLDRTRRELMDRIQTIPGVEIAGSIDDLPLSASEDKGFLEVEGRVAARNEMVSVRATAGEYFRAMQIPLKAGRYLQNSDVSTKPGEWWPTNVVVGASFAKRYFHDRTAIGHRLRVNRSRWATIVGVVGDVRHSGLEDAPASIIYLQNGEADSVVVRTSGDADKVISSIRRTVRDLDASGVIADVRTMSQYVDQAAARRKFQTVVLSSLAGVALFLMLAGLFGLLSYAVQQRLMEIGVRMTVGASRGSIVRMIVFYGLKLASAGLAIGILAAMMLMRAMASFVYGVQAIDPLTFVAVPIFVVIVTIVACGGPARKASGVDPLDVWRR